MSQSPTIDNCIAACIQCSIECDDCAENANRSGGMDELERVCTNCSDMCRFCVDSLQVGSYADCDECAEACESCAATCEHYDFDYCRKCAEACRKCSQACRAVTDEQHLFGIPELATERIDREIAGPGGL